MLLWKRGKNDMAKNSGRFYTNAAKNSIGKSTITEVRNGRGDHVKVYGINPETGKSEMMVIPMKLKGNGTENVIVKWLKRMGVILGIIGFLLLIIANHTNFL